MGIQGWNATPGTMGLSWEAAAWVRVDLGVLLCWHNGDLPPLVRGESPVTSLAAIASGVVWGMRVAGRSRKPSHHVTGRRDLDCEPPALFCILLHLGCRHVHPHVQQRCDKHKAELSISVIIAANSCNFLY